MSSGKVWAGWTGSVHAITYDPGHPYSLTRHRDTLYLRGFKPEDNAFRIWKVNRIESAQVDSMPFIRRSGFNAGQFLAGSLGVYHDSGDTASTVVASVIFNAAA